MLCAFHGKHNMIFSGHIARTRATNTLVSPQFWKAVGFEKSSNISAMTVWRSGCIHHHRLCSMNRFEAPQSYGRRERFPEVAIGGPQYQIMLAMECAKHFLPSAASRDVPVCHCKAPTVLVATSCTTPWPTQIIMVFVLKQKIRAYIVLYFFNVYFLWWNYTKNK